MRITIELSEAEGRATAIHRESGSALAADATPVDGGPPPEALLVALGAAAARATGEATALPQGGDAGGPPAWLVEVVTGGRERPS
jgi:hypothetical protein